MPDHTRALFKPDLILMSHPAPTRRCRNIICPRPDPQQAERAKTVLSVIYTPSVYAVIVFIEASAYRTWLRFDKSVELSLMIGFGCWNSSFLGQKQIIAMSCWALRWSCGMGVRTWVCRSHQFFRPKGFQKQFRRYLVCHTKQAGEKNDLGTLLRIGGYHAMPTRKQKPYQTCYKPKCHTLFFYINRVPWKKIYI